MSWWFPFGGPGNSNPVPVEVIATGTDPGIQGFWPPSRAHPLPVQAVAGTPPPVTAGYPPSWAAPLAVHQITAGNNPPGGGYEGPWPPNSGYPMPVVVITTGADPGVQGWRPYSTAFPCPVVMV